MLRAVNQQTQADVISVDDQWDVESLREWSRDNLLICPGCQQPVHFRAGETRVWHFAHKHRGDCTYDDASAALLQARVRLYQWVAGKYADKQGYPVTVEHNPNHPGIPRPVDCWVGQQEHAYWLLDSQLKPQMRETLPAAFAKLRISVQWLFLVDMLREDPNGQGVIHLTTTERDLLRHSIYDEPHNRYGETLHYLDTKNDRLITYRGLRLIHEPQQFQGVRFETPLGEVLLHPKTGEPVHPGEQDALDAFQARRSQPEPSLSEISVVRQSVPIPGQIESSEITEPVETPILAPPPPRQTFVPLGTPVGTCVECGQQTNDWWSYDGTTQTCKCNDCLRKRHARKE